MARFKATARGPVPFTAEEEAARDAEEAAEAQKAQERAEFLAAKGYIRDRRIAYKNAVMTLKGYDGGDFIDGLGFVIDALIGELVARGDAVTPEFSALLEVVAEVKAAHPKPT